MRSSLLIVVLLISWYSSQLYSKTESSEITKASQYLEERGEVCFNVYVNSLTDLDHLTNIISIDKVEGNKVFAYANREGFNEFLNHDLYYEVVTPPGLLTTIESVDTPDGAPSNWTKYPKFSEYLEILNDFESKYPNLCKVEQYGTSVNGKELMVVKVSDNVNEEEEELEFLATSSIHGDETLGYILMLRMIEYLCENYPSDETVKRIVENLQLWICPLTNPDGTYRGNDEITGPRRFNVNNVDLNRNFPCPGHKYGEKNKWEKETEAILDIENAHSFILGLDIHGGMETVVYPWAYIAEYPVDRTWWVYVCKNYANTAQDNSPSGYMTRPINTGYGSAGKDYYLAVGTRIDGPYFWSHCRAFTLELHSNKFLEESRLDAHWDYNKEALLNLFLETLNGVHGKVTDLATAEPIDNVKVFVENLDADSSFTRSGKNGLYARPIHEGTYSFIFSHPDYESKTVDNVSVKNGEETVLDVQLWDGSTGINKSFDTEKHVVSIIPGGRGYLINTGIGRYNSVISIYTIHGELLRTLSKNAAGKQGIPWDGKNYRGQVVCNGCYLLKVRNSNGTLATSFIINH